MADSRSEASVMVCVMTLRFLLLVRPARSLPILATLISLFFPLESSALTRQNLHSGSFFASEWETCRNDPVNNSDPLGLSDVAGTDIYGNSIRADDPEFLRLESVREFEAERRLELEIAADRVAGYVMPDPVGSYLMARGQADIAFDPNQPASYRCYGALGMVCGSILTVTDVIPVKSAVQRRIVKSVAARETEKVVENAAKKSATGLVRSSLPDLSGTVAEAFKGAPRIRTFKVGDRIYRSPNLLENTLESVDRPGPWLSTRRTVTKLGTESQLNVLKWSNPLEEVRTYEFTAAVTVYYGKVAGGKGFQILLPRDVDPTVVLKYIEKVPLK